MQMNQAVTQAEKQSSSPNKSAPNTNLTPQWIKHNSTELVDNYTILVNKYKEYILEMELIIVSKTLTEGYFFVALEKKS